MSASAASATGKSPAYVRQTETTPGVSRPWVIRVEGIGKRYNLGGPKSLNDNIREDVMNGLRRLMRLSGEGRGREGFWALKDLEFEVGRGETLGIIGRNGAGKSTLLKILSRITPPTEGTMRYRGRLQSLLEVGTGFHRELTGRENIYLNGAILGMRRHEIHRQFAAIVEFSGIERFLDTPVKFYSSGMYVRLAFAVAAHLRADILVVDEVLAVGDAEFQKKCLGKMQDVSTDGRTVLFVSHNMAALESLCRRAILLEQGRLVAQGASSDVIQRYLSSMARNSGEDLAARKDRAGDGRLRFTRLAVRRDDGATVDVGRCGEDIEFHLEYEGSPPELRNVSVSLGIYSIAGQCMAVLSNTLVGAELAALAPRGRIVCRLPRLPLSPGGYFFNLYCEVNGVLADWIQRAADFTVESADFYGTGKLPPDSHGGFLLDHAWSLEPDPPH